MRAGAQAAVQDRVVTVRVRSRRRWVADEGAVNECIGFEFAPLVPIVLRVERNDGYFAKSGEARFLFQQLRTEILIQDGRPSVVHA